MVFSMDLNIGLGNEILHLEFFFISNIFLNIHSGVYLSQGAVSIYYFAIALWVVMANWRGKSSAITSVYWSSDFNISVYEWRAISCLTCCQYNLWFNTKGLATLDFHSAHIYEMVSKTKYVSNSWSEEMDVSPIDFFHGIAYTNDIMLINRLGRWMVGISYWMVQFLMDQIISKHKYLERKTKNRSKQTNSFTLNDSNLKVPIWIIFDINRITGPFFTI